MTDSDQMNPERNAQSAGCWYGSGYDGVSGRLYGGEEELRLGFPAK